MKKLKPFVPKYDREPKYTVKEVSNITDLSSYTIRYYDNTGLIPGVDRTLGNARMFSDYSLTWLKLIHCLRATGLSINGIREYIDMCLVGESTIPQRATIIFKQEEILQNQIIELQQQMEVLKYKKAYYQEILANRSSDRCNPAAVINQNYLPKTSDNSEQLSC
ncbi:MAG: MerR family transcriptional regulator [Lentisphaeria bacterium]